MKTRLRSPHPVHHKEVENFFFGNDPKGLVKFLRSHEKSLTQDEFKLLAEDAFLLSCCYETLTFLKEIADDPVVSGQLSALAYDNVKMRPLELALSYGHYKTACFLVDCEKFKATHDLFFVDRSLLYRLESFSVNEDFWAFKEHVFYILNTLLDYDDFPQHDPEDTAKMFSLLIKEKEKSLAVKMIKKAGNEEGVLRYLLKDAMQKAYHFSTQNHDFVEKSNTLIECYNAAPPDAQARFFAKTKDLLEEHKKFYEPIFTDQSRQELKKGLPKDKFKDRSVSKM